MSCNSLEHVQQNTFKTSVRFAIAKSPVDNCVVVIASQALSKALHKFRDDSFFPDKIVTPSAFGKEGATG